MKAIDWRGPINEILFGLTFTPEITVETVHWNADYAVHYTVLGDGPDVYYQAIGEALASGERLDGLNELPQFNQEQVAEFLRALATRLDDLRPWPEPKCRQLDPTMWSSFGRAAPIARLDASIRRVTDILQKGFTPFRNAQPQEHVLMLGLQTGETVALLGSYGRGEKVTLLSDATDDPATTIDHFIAATGFPADKVTRL